MRLGAVLPNESRRLTGQELECLEALGDTFGVVRSWDYTPPAAVDQIMDLNPDVLWVPRSSGNGQIDPIGWAHALQDHVHYLRATGAEIVLGPVNEPNHHFSPYQGEAGRVEFAMDYRKLLGAIYRRCGRFPKVSPNLAVMQDDEAWTERFAASIDQHLYQGVNAYWQGENHLSPDWGLRLMRFHDRIPSRPMIVLEIGDATEDRDPFARVGRISANLMALKDLGYVEAACVFILGAKEEDDSPWARYLYPPDAWAIMAASQR